MNSYPPIGITPYNVSNATKPEIRDCSIEFPRAEQYYHDWLVFINLCTYLSLETQYLTSIHPWLVIRFLTNLRHDIGQVVLVSLCSLLSVCTLGMYAREMFSQYFRYTDPGKRLRTLVLLGLYPMTSLMSCFAVLVPRSTQLADVIATCYLSVSLYVFVTILIQYYGNKETLIQTLSPDMISIATPPCCCCCRCLPAVGVSRRSLRVFKSLVLQTAIFQPLVTFTKAVVWTDNNSLLSGNTPSSPFFYMNILSAISTLLAVYGLAVLVKASDKYLVKHRIRLKFLLMQLVLLSSNLQAAIFLIITRAGLPKCDGLLGTNVKSSLIHHELLILELFILSMLASYVYRRAESTAILNLRANVENVKIEEKGTNGDTVPDKLNMAV